MLAQCTLKMPHGVYSGRGVLDHVKEIAGRCAIKVTVFSNQGIIGAGFLEKPSSLIKEAGVEYSVLDGLPAEPDCDQVQAVINRSKTEESDFIVAVGGGSVMDIAKLAFVLATDVYTARSLLDNPRLAGKCVPVLMIPTTAGIGSEATPNGIMAVPEGELEVGIVNDAMIADYVILDGEMIRHLPRKIAAVTGVDALAHGTECYTFNKANPFSDILALEALGLIFSHVERTCDDPDALDAENAMLIAALYTGAVITASGTTATHVLSYPLGGKYHTPHGVSNAILLTPVMKFNEPVCRERPAAVYDWVAKGGRESGLSPEEKSVWIIRCLDEIAKHLEISNSLKECGTGDEDLDVLVEAGMDVKWLLANNMREVTAEDTRKLCLEIMR